MTETEGPQCKVAKKDDRNQDQQEEDWSLSNNIQSIGKINICISIKIIKSY